MARVITDNQHYSDIAAAIRTMTETDALFRPDEMAAAVLGISTGVGLNFAVVGGTTQPENPVENTIWISTDTEITSWALSNNDPTAPTEGMVRIGIRTNGTATFNALQENAIDITPSSARQYISGEWIKKDCVVYQGGAWVLPILNIIPDSIGSMTASENAEVTAGTDNVEIYAGSNAEQGPASYAMPAEVSGFSTMHIDAALTIDNAGSSEYTVSIGIFSDAACANQIAGYTVSTPEEGTNLTIYETYDISAVSGSVYVGFSMNSHSGSLYYVTCTLNDIYLE